MQPKKNNLSPSTNVPVNRYHGPNLRKLVREAVNLLRLKNGDVVLVKQNSPLATRQTVEALAEAFGRQGFNKSLVCIVENFTDLTALDETEMRALGWQRIPPEGEHARSES